MEDYEVPKFTLFLPVILPVIALFLLFLLLLLFFFSFLLFSTPILRIDNSKKVNAEVYHGDLFLLPVPTPQQIKNQPTISAQGTLVLDVTRGVILFSKNPNLRFSLASATKIMTAVVSLGFYSLNDVLTIDDERIPGSSMGLTNGEKITVENLLYGMLLNSGNDAAYTLAKNYPAGVSGFIREMNKKAKELGLSNTSFSDPAGLDDDDNFTTGLDLAKLSTSAIANPNFSRIVATREKTVFDTTGRMRHDLQNLNKLLWEVPAVSGIKTGSTERARGVLVALVKQQERTLLIIVFKSDDRFADTKILIDWILEQTREQ